MFALAACTIVATFFSIKVNLSGTLRLLEDDSSPEIPVARRRDSTLRSKLVTRLDRPVEGPPRLDFIPGIGLLCGEGRKDGEMGFTPESRLWGVWSAGRLGRKRFRHVAGSPGGSPERRGFFLDEKCATSFNGEQGLLTTPRCAAAMSVYSFFEVVAVLYNEKFCASFLVSGQL